MPESVKIQIDGKAYDFEDFEGREIIAAERAFDISLMSELERGSMTGMYALLFMVKRRENGTITPDEVMSIKIGEASRMLSDDETDPPKPATRAKAKTA